MRGKVEQVMEGFVDVSVLMQGGVYLLCAKGKVVYVGQARKLHARVSTHCRMKPRTNGTSDRALPVIKFDKVLVMPCGVADADRIEADLIKRFDPKYNSQRRTGPPCIPLEELMRLSPAMQPNPPATRRASFRRF